MEKRDSIILLLLAGGAGYGIYANWDTIADKLDLHEYDALRIKAIDLAKKSVDFESGSTNWQYLRTRQQRYEIEVADDAWVAEPISDREYRVTVRWTEDGERVLRGFRVDIGASTVQYLGEVEAAAAPR